MPSTTKSHGTSSMIAAAPGPALLATGPSPLSWWKFEETGTGAPAYDTGGGGIGATALDNSATTVPASTVAPVHFPNVHARNFPAGSSGMSSGPWAAHNLLDNFSVSCWVKPAAFTTAMTIMSRMNDAAGIGWNVWTDGPANGQPGAVLFQAMNGPGVRNYAGASSPFLQLNVWSHVAAVMQSGTRSVYINGAQVGVTDSSPMKPTTPDMITSLGEWASDLSHPWNGDLDDLRYYNVALTPAQIATLAGGDDLAGGVGNLIGYWKLDEVGTAQTAIDSSPVGADATEHGGFSVDVTTPAPIAAPTLFSNPHSRRFGQPPNNWLNAGVQPLHGLTQNFTVACWYRSLTTGVAAVPLVTHQNAFPTTKGWGLMIAGTPPPGPGRAALPSGTIAPSLQSCTSAGATPIFADAALARGVWTHIAGVFSATSGRLYVNGVKQSAVLSTMPAASTDLPTYLGRDYSNTGGPTQIVGDLDEVRIYNVALTSDQVSSLAAGLDPFAVAIVTKTHKTDARIVITADNYAKFIQRDNWKNGTWIGHYGSQGYEIIYSDGSILATPGVTYDYTYTSGSVDSWGRPGIFTDPRFFQCVNNPGQTSAGVLFASGVGQKVLITYLLDDAKAHAISIAAINIDVPSRRYHINVYDNDTNALLDGPRDVGDYYTTDVYMTWNVKGHVRFECVVDNNMAGIGALFVDPPMSVGSVNHSTDTKLLAVVAATASFVQRDNWRNGAWINHYGAQGYALFYSGILDVMPPGVSYTLNGGIFDGYAQVGVHPNEPRFLQVPGQPGNTVAGLYYTTTSETVTFLLDDGLIHGISIVALDYLDGNDRFTIAVYDADTNALLDAARAVGDHATTDVYMTWNVSGHVRFVLTTTVGYTQPMALFVDAPRTVRGVTHGTDTLLPATMVVSHRTDADIIAIPPATAVFVQRDNWRNGTWIGHYGFQGYDVFNNTGVPALMPPGVSYTRTGFNFFSYEGPPTDLRLPQLPGDPTSRASLTWFANDTGFYTFLLDDGLVHSVSIFFLDYEPMARRFYVQVYDADTNALIAGRQDSDDYGTKSIYMTWNVSGHVRFDIFSIAAPNTTTFALFVDPPRSVGGKTHTTDTALRPAPVTVTKPFTTDALLRATVVKTHTTDAVLLGTRTRVYYTDSLRQATAVKTHTTDTLFRTTVVKTFTTDAQLRATVVKTHLTDAWLCKVVTRTHTTDALLRGTVVKTHTTDTGLCKVVTRTHDTSTLLGTTVSTTHFTDTSLAITNHLISYWKLDEAGTGQVAIDSMSLGANATDVLGTTVPSTLAPVNFTNPGGRNISGDGTYLDTGVQPAHSLTQNFTMAGWIRPWVVQFAPVLAHTTNPYDGSQSRGWALTLLNDNTPAMFVCSIGNAAALYDWGNHIEVGVWVHLAGVVYDNNTFAMFVNGRKVPGNGYPDPTPDLRTFIGRLSNNPSYGMTSTADYDDVRLYDIALTDAQIGSLAAGILDPLVVTVATRAHSTDAALVVPPTTVTKTHDTDASLVALPAVFAQFVQRDNWRNGAWINHYGVQGYSLFRNGIPYALPPESTIPDVMPPGVTYTMYAAYDQGLDPAVYTDPRLLQDPTRPGYTTKAIYYNGDPSRYAVFRFDDGLSHAVSLYQLDYDHEHARYTITVYDDATGTLLDGPREVGDYETTGVYMTWNVRGHIRFYSTPEVAYSYTSALFVDPPRSVGAQAHNTDTALLGGPVTVTKTHSTDALCQGTILKTHSTDSSLVPTLVTSAMFVQRDNWRNGINWIGQYGSQGYAIIGGGVPDVLPVGVSYTNSGGITDSWGPPGVYTDPRFVQSPINPTKSSAGAYYVPNAGAILSWVILFNDHLAHSISFCSLNIDVPSRRFHVNVYDNDTNVLISGPHASGDFYTTSVYLTWNVTGHVRFEYVVDVSMATVGAMFIDPPMSIVGKTHQTDVLVAIAPTVVTTTHGTDTSIAVAPPAAATAAFVQRDNWLGGKWIGTYGTQGNAVFLTGTPTVLPPKVSYKVAGGKYDCWLPPGTYTDPRLPQVPGQPDKTAAAVYHTEDTECFFFNFDDGLKHAVSIFSLDYDQGDLRHQIEVYDDDTDTRIDGPRDVGDQYTNSVYMTWNVTGHIRFELVTDAENAVATAWFIDPPIIVGGAVHGTDTLISGTGTVVKTHKTDSLLEGLVGQGVMMSRSRSQRVGTRTLAFGDQP